MAHDDDLTLLADIYGGALNLHRDLHNQSQRHRERHGQSCTVHPHSVAAAPIWPLLTAIVGARRYLEVGCGLGYTAALMAESGGPGARVDTIEKDDEHADLADRELTRKGLTGRVRILRGDALNVLPGLEKPYDIVFVDFDWKDYPAILPHVTRLTRPGGFLLTSNLFPLFEQWARSLPYRESVKEYITRLVRDGRFRTFIMRSEWKALSYKLIGSVP